MNVRTLAAASTAVILAICASTQANTLKPEIGTFGFNVEGMDRSVTPGDDFIRYAVGKWLDTAEIPPDRSSVGSVAVIREKAAARVRGIIGEAGEANEPEGSETRKIGDYFRAFMDEARIEQLGASPLKPELDAIAAIKTHKDLSAALGASIRSDVDVLNLGNFYTTRIMSLWVAEDLDDSTKYRPYLLQGGLGMPDREYYLGSNARYAELRTKYEAHVANMLRLAGYGNWRRARLFEYRRNLAKLGRPVDRGEWFMTPQTVNALFAPCQNSITLPAAILAPTFFDPNADAAVNYGALGAGLGHEVSHGFDDNGALFDADGNLRNWWTQADRDHFKVEAKKLADQYSAYEPLPGLHINGQQTSTENIADVAGLATAWDAYQLSLKGQPAPMIDGFTAEQRFFLGFAQNYRAKFREAALRRQIVTDILPPAPYRALTVRNLDAWYSTFDVKPGQKLYLAPADRVKIW